MGFVSNSSSTAFLVGFDTIPKNFCELEEMFWQDKPTVGMYHDSSIIDMASAAFHIMKESIERNGIVKDAGHAIKLIDPYGMYTSGEYPGHAKEIEQMRGKWTSTFEGKHVVYMEVSDEGSELGSDLEEYMKTILPRRLPSLAVSKH